MNISNNDVFITKLRNNIVSGSYNDSARNAHSGGVMIRFASCACTLRIVRAMCMKNMRSNASGGVGGGILLAIVSVIKAAMAK